MRLRALFDGVRRIRELAAATLAAVLGARAGRRIAVEHVEDRVWEREWLKDFRPMRFGRRLWVCPAGQQPDGRAAVVLELDPGLAFGTGTHATTALCLEWLDGHPRAASGCSTTAAAPASSRSPRSSSAPRRPRIRHRSAGHHRDARKRREERARRRLAVAERAERIAGPFDIVLANILAGPLVELAPRLAADGRAGGALVLAGMLERQAAEVAQAYRPWFDIGPGAEREGWILLAGRRRAE